MEQQTLPHGENIAMFVAVPPVGVALTAHVIGSRLTGKALTWYQTVSEETKEDPEQLLAALGRRFGSASQPERHYASLQGRRRQKGSRWQIWPTTSRDWSDGYTRQ